VVKREIAKENRLVVCKAVPKVAEPLEVGMELTSSTGVAREGSRESFEP
jgi:hypothetical protein